MQEVKCAWDLSFKCYLGLKGLTSFFWTHFPFFHRHLPLRNLPYHPFSSEGSKINPASPFSLGSSTCSVNMIWPLWVIKRRNVIHGLVCSAPTGSNFSSKEHCRSLSDTLYKLHLSHMLPSTIEVKNRNTREKQEVQDTSFTAAHN